MGKVKKSHGNMYEWVTHMWSPSVGCPHQCIYCYITAHKALPETITMELPFPQLGTGRTIFVGFECDLFAEGVSSEDISSVLTHCRSFDNNYVFQSKNPARIVDFISELPANSLIGTTIETNRGGLISAISKAPSPWKRAYGLQAVKKRGFKTFVTVEPILDCDPFLLRNMIVTCDPEFVNIGADSKDRALKEPSKEAVMSLIELIQDEKIEIRNKSNLARLLT